MNEEELNRGTMGPKTKVGVIVGVAAMISGAVVLLLDPELVIGMGRGMHSFERVIAVRRFISTFNVVLLVVLAWSYLVVYRERPNRFTFSLLLVAVALLRYAIAATPAIHLLFGFHGGPGLRPFAFLPDLVAAVAIIVLLYQSFQ